MEGSGIPRPGMDQKYRPEVWIRGMNQPSHLRPDISCFPRCPHTFTPLPLTLLRHDGDHILLPDQDVIRAGQLDVSVHETKLAV